MGTYHENRGYSAAAEGFFVLGDMRLRLAKTNGRSFTLSQPHELAPGTEGDLVIIVDEQKHSKRVLLPDGATGGQTLVRYRVTAPF